jgi:hypothetical protein
MHSGCTPLPSLVKLAAEGGTFLCFGRTFLADFSDGSGALALSLRAPAARSEASKGGVCGVVLRQSSMGALGVLIWLPGGAGTGGYAEG